MSVLDTFDGVYVIAEIGINHNGDLEAAKRLITAAAHSGANGVKFQVRDLESVYTGVVLADDLKAEQGTQYLLDQLRKTLLSFDQIAELYRFASQYDVDFFATPFDKKSATFLNDLGIKLFKIGSPDFTNWPLIEHVASFGKPIILSTGMATEAEIVAVSNMLKAKAANFSLLHCSSTYPAATTDINLRFMAARLPQLASRTHGYSGHEIGFAPTLAAVALGARMIERHITFDRMAEGPDHRASLVPEDFRKMVDGIREIERSLGVAEKRISQGELNNRLSLAKSLVAATDLPVGHVLTEKDFEARSPAKGVSPLRLREFLGKTLAAPLRKDDYFSERHLGTASASEAKRYSIPKTWGIVGRLNDFRDFLDMQPDLIEIHMTWRDVVNYSPLQGNFAQDLVVHAPEYYQDSLIDFSSPDADITEMSLEMLRKVIAVARDLAPHFAGMHDPRGPRVVVHPGGHFPGKVEAKKPDQYRRLMRNLRSVDSRGVRILVENMPPFPWYFGGQWTNTIFLDAREVAQFAREMQWGICYDTSHAQLYCAHAGISLLDFTKDIIDCVQYLHISDAKGVTHEGLQIGEGEIDFPQLFALLAKVNPGFIPEIWQGHLDRGHGFRAALDKIETMLSKSSGPSCSCQGDEVCAAPDHGMARGSRATVAGRPRSA